jgi:hypothetical protein
VISALGLQSRDFTDHLVPAPNPPSPLRRRSFLALALATIAVGLGVHELGLGLSNTVRDISGDALWAVMIFAWLGALWPSGALGSRAGLALLICWAVELSQIYHTPQLDVLRETTIGQLVLGSGFDVRDLGAYALGVLAISVLELAVRRALCRPRKFA